jgi:hypothetical protein
MNHRAPSFGQPSFSCPHCNAISHQNWFELRASQNTIKPYLFSERDRAALVKSPQNYAGFLLKSQIDISDLERIIIGDVIIAKKTSDVAGRLVTNIHISQCFSCNKVAIWRYDTLLYPVTSYEVKPNDDMPDDIKADFLEAASIVNLSPRGACALLRLAIEKLCVHLGGKGRKLDDDIAMLVKKGLNKGVQQSLDYVRVIGNEALHPGQLDLKDDQNTAETLFGLVNYVVDELITKPKSLDEIYNRLPSEKRRQIENRDKVALSPSKGA